MEERPISVAMRVTLVVGIPVGVVDQENGGKTTKRRENGKTSTKTNLE